MRQQILKNQKVAILLETEYIPAEIEHYQKVFAEYGAQVDLLTYLWGERKRILVSDVTSPDTLPQVMSVEAEIAHANPNDYAIVLVAANYVACRLREISPMGSLGGPDQLRTPAAVQFIMKAMENPNIIKGALCHGLWLWTACPEKLAHRKVICHTVVLADVMNAGGHFVADPSHVVVDEDLVTGRSVADLEAYTQAIIDTYINRRTNHV
ncbi:MAG: DJ-1/PfpI family protein [Eubacteriales bacterium]